MHFILSKHCSSNTEEFDSPFLTIKNLQQLDTSGFMCKFKIQFDSNFCFSILKKQRLCLVVMNNRQKFQCYVAENKVYRAVQSLHVNCKLKAEFL